jgi:hypothetical protein
MVPRVETAMPPVEMEGRAIILDQYCYSASRRPFEIKDKGSGSIICPHVVVGGALPDR